MERFAMKLKNTPITWLALAGLLAACAPMQLKGGSASVSLSVKSSSLASNGSALSDASGNNVPLPTGVCYFLNVTASDNAALMRQPGSTAACTSGQVAMPGLGLIAGFFAAGQTASLSVPIGPQRRFDLLGVPQSAISDQSCNHVFTVNPSATVGQPNGYIDGVLANNINVAYYAGVTADISSDANIALIAGNVTSPPSYGCGNNNNGGSGNSSGLNATLTLNGTNNAALFLNVSTPVSGAAAYKLMAGSSVGAQDLIPPQPVLSGVTGNNQINVTSASIIVPNQAIYLSMQAMDANNNVLSTTNFGALPTLDQSWSQLGTISAGNFALSGTCTLSRGSMNIQYRNYSMGSNLLNMFPQSVPCTGTFNMPKVITPLTAMTLAIDISQQPDSNGNGSSLRIVSNVTPPTRYITVINSAMATMISYPISTATGAPITTSGVTTTTLSGALPVYNPTGSYLYTTSGGTTTVSEFALSNGALTGASTGVSSSASMSAPYVSPNGQLILGTSGVTTTAISINTSGLVTGTPVSTIVPSSPVSITMDTTANYAYLASGGYGGSIYMYSATTAGALTPLSLASVTAAASGNKPSQILTSPQGNYVVVTTNAASGSNTVQSFQIQSNGTLAAIGNATSTNGTSSLAAPAAMDPTGRYVYVLNGSVPNIVAYALNPGTGTLTTIGSPVSVTNPLALTGTMAVDATGSYLYVPSGSGTTPSTIEYYPINFDGSLGSGTATPSFPMNFTFSSIVTSPL